MTPLDRQGLDNGQADLIRSRQRGRARVMALLLGAFVILVFAISIAKIRAGMPH
jgi:hypothetical protein